MSDKTAIQPAAPSAATAISPRDLYYDLERLKPTITAIAYGMFGNHDQKTCSMVTSKILMGQELGIAPIASVRCIHLFNGKMSLSADLMASLATQDGWLVSAEHSDPPGEWCNVTFTPNKKLKDEGYQPESFRWTMEMAKASGLIRAGSQWEKQTWDMLYARAVTHLARKKSPRCSGIYTPEELRADPETYIQQNETRAETSASVDPSPPQEGGSPVQDGQTKGMDAPPAVLAGPQAQPVEGADGFSDPLLAAASSQKPAEPEAPAEQEGGDAGGGGTKKTRPTKLGCVKCDAVSEHGTLKDAKADGWENVCKSDPDEIEGGFTHLGSCPACAGDDDQEDAPHPDEQEIIEAEYSNVEPDEASATEIKSRIASLYMAWCSNRNKEKAKCYTLFVGWCCNTLREMGYQSVDETSMRQPEAWNAQILEDLERAEKQGY